MESGQVHCVRRLGLSDEAWESVSPTGEGNRMFAQERHITSVKMSPDKADEVRPSHPSCASDLWSIGHLLIRSTFHILVLDLRFPCILIHARPLRIANPVKSEPRCVETDAWGSIVPRAVF